LENVDEKKIQAIFEDLVKDNNIKLGAIAQPVRVALTGGTISPGIFETMQMLGKERILKRLKDALVIAMS